jgi:hypothetical protein
MLSLYVVTESCGEGYSLLSVCRSLSGVTDSIDDYFDGEGGYKILNRYDVGEFGVEYVLDISWWDVGQENFTKVTVRRVGLFDGLGFSLVDDSRFNLFLRIVLVFVFLVIVFSYMLCLT